MEEKDNVIVEWAQEDVEMSNNLLNNNLKKLSSAILSTTDFTWYGLVSKPGLPGNKPVTNWLSVVWVVDSIIWKSTLSPS